MLNCEICGRECKNFIALSQHVKKHKLTSQEYYDKYLSSSSEHLCKYCGKPVTTFKDINRGYNTVCSVECSRQHVFKNLSQQSRDKAAKTKLDRYGSATYNNSQKRAATVAGYTEEQKQAIKDKRQITCQQRYGVNTPMESAIVRETWSKNYFNKTGYTHQSRNPEVKEKIRTTCLEKYGVDNCRKSPIIKQKIKDTKLLRYGNQNNFEKLKETNLQRYGAECCWSNPDVRTKCCQRYNYMGITFDSKLELAFYIYNKDIGNPIERNSEKYFEYNLNGKWHRCFPDFCVGDTLYELKGDQFRDLSTGK